MKKAAILFLLFLEIIFFVPGQTTEPIDLILVLDTSSSMSGSYREVTNYISGPFLKEFLRIGDTFHLISFSGSPHSEISRKIEGIGDVETVIGRLFLMAPLDPYTDIAGALNYTERYIARLPSSRPRKVVFVTDGDQNPEPENSAAPVDTGVLETRVNETAARLRLNRTDFYLVRFPLTGNGPSSGRNGAPSRSTQTASPVSAQPPVVVQQQDSRQQSAEPQPPVAVQQQDSRQQSAEPQPPVTAPPQPDSQQGETPQPPVTAPPQPDSQQGETPQPPVTAPPQQNSQQSEAPQPPVMAQPPDSQQSAAQQQPEGIVTGRTSIAGGGFYILVLMGLGAASALGMGLIMFFMTRKLKSFPNRIMAYVAGRNVSCFPGNPVWSTEEGWNTYEAGRWERQAVPFTAAPLSLDRKDAEEFSSKGSLLLSLVVDDQNTNIGRRNIHFLKAGDVYTIGGSKSDDYFIFLVPIPAHVGEVQFNGKECTFIPKKPQYFPEIGSQPVSDCIGKIIRIVSDTRYELTFHLERYEDPLDSLNRLLNSVVLPPQPPDVAFPY